MKKLVLLLVVAMAFSFDGNAQGVKSLFGKLTGKNTETTETTETKNGSESSASSVLTDIIGAVTGGQKLTADALCGTWKYQGTSCELKSDEALAELGSKLVTVKAEEKINELLLKLGVEEGNTTFTFVNDGTCSVSVGERGFAGTYVIGEDAKSIVFSFLMGQLTLNSTVEYVAGSMDITFDADRVLALIKSLSAAVAQYDSSQASSSSVSSTVELVKSLSTMLESFNGMRLGVKVTK